LLVLLTTSWGLRLSWNFYRKGGYNPRDEDYRWKEVAGIINSKVLYEIFNFVFIAWYQQILLFLLVLPAYIAARSELPLNSLDYLATALFCLFLSIETVADNQQWNFHIKKHAESKTSVDKDVIRGFLTQGLFKYSRHPNFFSEQCIWWSFYLFSLSSSLSSQRINWTVGGAVLLSLLFLGSAPFTESITARKYPKYREYQKSTSMLIPWFPATPTPKKKL